MSGPGRGIRNVTIERHFGNITDAEIWTNIAKECGINVEFAPLDSKDSNQKEENNEIRKFI